jgi:hypothetical protein
LDKDFIRNSILNKLRFIFQNSLRDKLLLDGVTYDQLVTPLEYNMGVSFEGFFHIDWDLLKEIIKSFQKRSMYNEIYDFLKFVYSKNKVGNIFIPQFISFLRYAIPHTEEYDSEEHCNGVYNAILDFCQDTDKSLFKHILRRYLIVGPNISNYEYNFMFNLLDRIIGVETLDVFKHLLGRYSTDYSYSCSFFIGVCARMFQINTSDIRNKMHVEVEDLEPSTFKKRLLREFDEILTTPVEFFL